MFLRVSSLVEGKRAVAISEVEFASLATSRLFFLLFARCSGVVWFAPLFSRGEISRFVKVILALLLAALVFPVISASFRVDAPLSTSFGGGTTIRFLVAIASEFFIGAAIGLSLKLFFQSVYWAGETIARVGGVSVAESFDPLFGGEASPLSSFLFWLALAVFTACGGLEAFVDGFLNYFVLAPPQGVFVPEDLMERLFFTLSGSFTLGLRLAAPTIMATAVVYLGVGLNGRLFSQLNLSFASFNINALLTLFLLFLCIGVFCEIFETEFVSLMETFFAREI